MQRSAPTKIKLNTKQQGLTGDDVDMVKNDPDLECIIKLYEAVERVKNKNTYNKECVVGLKTMFGELDKNIQKVMKESKDQGSNAIAPPAKKGATPSAKTKE